jgi:hypothetical protein
LAGDLSLMLVDGILSFTAGAFTIEITLKVALFVGVVCF